MPKGIKGFKKGYIPWNKGRKCPEISKATKRCPLVSRNCLTCNKEFILRYNQVKNNNWGKFCSRICKGNEMKGKNNWAWKGNKPKCIDCGNLRSRIKGLRCRKCDSKYRVGEKSNGWKGGITLLHDRIRTCFKYKEWVKAVFQKDNYICQICGKRNGTHNADHIKPFAVILYENNIKTFEEALNCKELWDLNNGQILCEDCHKQTLSYLNPNIIQQYANPSN